MDWVVLIAAVWLICGAFTFWVHISNYKATFGRITRGDIGFGLFIAALGPASLGVGIAALCDGKFKKFWSKQVWP